MKFSQLLVPTLKEVPKDAEIASHRLMIRAGLIRKVASGIYNILPLGLKSLQKLETIIREEMTKIGAQEVLLPSIIPSELWEKSERWELYGKELLRLKDRMGRDFCYGPTHEEVITTLIGESLKSYKQLPVTLYQIQTKFRDEIRPRFGLMRAREFAMKDAYSFHDSQESLDEMYQKMAGAYSKIFERCGLKFQAVKADSGAIGGDESAEYMVLAETGEDEVLVCDHSGTATNKEAAATCPGTQSPRTDSPPYSSVSTPGCKSIEDVSRFLKTEKGLLIKSLLYKTNDRFVLALLRGDHELNELKLAKYCGASLMEKASEEDVTQISGTAPGFLGPLALKGSCEIVIDHSVDLNIAYVVGGNEKDVHIQDLVISRDLNDYKVYDLREAKEGDKSPYSEDAHYHSMRGIEVGHIFKLGDKYSKSMAASFLNENGQATPYLMGCYGVGIGRTIAAAIEQNHDEKGIIWPLSLAPFHVDVIIVNMKDPDLVKVGDVVYQGLLDEKIEVVLDDRAESVGVKFKDAELLGFPYQLVVGKLYKEKGCFELKNRRTGVVEEGSLEDVINALKEDVDSGL